MISELLWILLLNQVVMGAFDTVYHHELTERLPWRASQGHELALHAVRSLLYATVLLVLGFVEPNGTWALALLAVLTVEVAITLMDFVEEDLTRTLPASERINHTLLALNYGAILALLVPVLLDWSHAPTAIKPVWHGFWSLFMAVSGAGVLISGLRDFFAARRAGQLVAGRAAELVAAFPERQHVLVTGATGFIGSRLVAALAEAGHQVTVLARDPAKAAALTPPFRLITSLGQIASDAAVDTIVNLAGEPIANGLWTTAKRRRALRSRLKMTRDVVQLIARLERKPALLLNGSAIGWYGLWQDEALTEFDGGKACFTHRLCESWERMAMRAQRHGVRVVRLRIGLVLGTEGGFLTRMLTPFEFGLGGPMGGGRQWMSWIERDDLIRLIAHVIATPKLRGAVNATAPVPVRNADFARELGRAFRRPAFIPIPAFALRVLGDLADELLLGGQQVLPDKALASGFTFRHETLRSALAAMLPRRSMQPAHKPLDRFRVATPETKV
jgi:uncharacterized protein (TIGR01777 family)